MCIRHTRCPECFACAKRGSGVRYYPRFGCSSAVCSLGSALNTLVISHDNSTLNPVMCHTVVADKPDDG